MKSIYEVQTFNDALESENRIHSDDIAKQFGFEGALVGGVVVFGHMTYLPAKAEGEAWLTNNEIEVRFIKPAYDGDLLTIECESTEGATETHCMNAAKTLLSTMTSRHKEQPPNPVWTLPPATVAPPREPITWDNLHTEQPAPAYTWTADDESNMALTEQLEDDLDMYRGADAVVHPFWLLRQCNSAFMRSFVLPAWIHVGSKMQCHKPVRVGDEVETRMVPLSKWERKGHQFTTLYIPFIVDGEVRVEVEHTSIFKIAPAQG